jgi:hypothetical protein
MATSTDLRAAINEVHRQLPAKQVESPDGTFEFEPDWSTRIEQSMGHTPWWVISTVVHAVIFLLCTLIGVALPPPNMDEVTIASDIAKPEEPKYDEKKKRDLFRNPQEIKHETETERPVVIHEQREVAPEFETDNNMDSRTARGQEDAISDIPLGGAGVTGSMGVGGGGMAGCFGYRDGGGRRQATKRFGGSPATESAVEAALLWLKRHQEPGGYWDAHKWKDTGRVFVNRNRGNVKRPATDRVNVSMTGMAMLSFLGAGYTAKAGKHKATVAGAQNWMLKVLDDRANAGQKYGTFDTCNYTQGMATLAIAEAYGMTKTPELRKAAQAAIDVIIANQGPYEAWNYRDKKGKAGRNDTSVSGWNLMALKSAKIAGLKVDSGAFQGCMRWLDAATDPANGKCSYSGYVGGKRRSVRRGSGSEAMWAAGMLMRQFMGAKRDDPILQKAAKTIGEKQPSWETTTIPARTYPARTYPARTYPARTIPARTIGGKTYPARTIPARTIPARTIPARTIPARKSSRNINLYYWYYATLCMFQMGDDVWKTWNVNMKKALIGNQRKGGPLDGSKQDVDGSWDPIGGGHVSYGGRVFSTSLGALTLEVYYRYLPLYTQQ